VRVLLCITNGNRTEDKKTSNKSTLQ
jgi:hypothetical protein